MHNITKVLCLAVVLMFGLTASQAQNAAVENDFVRSALGQQRRYLDGY